VRVFFLHTYIISYIIYISHIVIHQAHTRTHTNTHTHTFISFQSVHNETSSQSDLAGGAGAPKTGTHFTCYTSTKVQILTGGSAGALHIGTQFTWFTSTKVQILTPGGLCLCGASVTNRKEQDRELQQDECQQQEIWRVDFVKQSSSSRGMWCRFVKNTKSDSICTASWKKTESISSAVELFKQNSKGFCEVERVLHFCLIYSSICMQVGSNQYNSWIIQAKYNTIKLSVLLLYWLLPTCIQTSILHEKQRELCCLIHKNLSVLLFCLIYSSICVLGAEFLCLAMDLSVCTWGRVHVHFHGGWMSVRISLSLSLSLSLPPSFSLSLSEFTLIVTEDGCLYACGSTEKVRVFDVSLCSLHRFGSLITHILQPDYTNWCIWLICHTFPMIARHDLCKNALDSSSPQERDTPRMNQKFLDQDISH
jgi:hypothetical protein